MTSQRRRIDRNLRKRIRLVEQARHEASVAGKLPIVDAVEDNRQREETEWRAVWGVS